MIDAPSPVRELEEEIGRFLRERDAFAGAETRRSMAEIYLAATQHAAEEAAAAALPDGVEADAMTPPQRAHYVALVTHADELHRWVEECRTALALEAKAPMVRRINDHFDGTT